MVITVTILPVAVGLSCRHRFVVHSNSNINVNLHSETIGVIDIRLREHRVALPMFVCRNTILHTRKSPELILSNTSKLIRSNDVWKVLFLIIVTSDLYRKLHHCLFDSLSSLMIDKTSKVRITWAFVWGINLTTTGQYCKRFDVMTSSQLVLYFRLITAFQLIWIALISLYTKLYSTTLYMKYRKQNANDWCFRNNILSSM